MKYKDLPIQIKKTSILYSAQVEGYPPGASIVSRDEAIGQAVREFLKKFFKDCAANETVSLDRK